MGQTLTHGIYLPDEGERNCYNGLAANWQLLDGAVGTVAEHTTALAGKAPLVHTHTVSQITDFPAYGNAAGTICEGNDSRLSDARTPVAHTHTKSDVTDLLNSNFIPSANNSYDLGSSSYQWNNLYAKNYYYNGVAWGLDQANVWSADQATTGNLFIKFTNLQKGVIPSSNTHKNLYFSDKNGANIGVIRLRLSTGGGGSFRVYGSTLVKDGQIDPTGAEFNWGFGQYLNPDGTTYFSFDGNIANDLIPTSSNYNLGNSTNKWKSLNGVNPGALSLPNINTSIAVDTTNWVYDGATFNEIKINNATQTISGWLYIIINNASSDDVIVVRYAGSDSGNLTYAQYKSGLSYVSLVAPIMPGVKTYVASRKAFSTIKIYHSLGNV